MKSEFKHFPVRPAKLTAGFAQRQYGKLLADLAAAEAAAEPAKWMTLYQQWNALKAYVSGEGARIGHAFNRDLSDKRLQAAERYFRQKIIPAITPAEHRLVKAFLASRHRGALERRFGQLLGSVYQTQLKPLDPANSALNVQVGELTTAYDQLIAAAQVKVGGQTMTLWKARSLGISEDPGLRQAAYLARGDWFLAHHRRLSKTFDKLVGLRAQMAHNVGYSSFTPLAYEIMGRTDYGPPEVAAFRGYIRRHLVPLWERLALDSARRLGDQKLKAWDLMYAPGLSLPLGIVPVESQLDGAEAMFERLLPRLNRHFKRMRREGLIDLESRPHKRSGAYCTEFADEGRVAILLNSTGDAEDISTLTHEMGHAFMGWESQRIEAVDLQWPTADLCEVHSMGLEFLCLPLVDQFFSAEHTARFTRHRWREAVYTLCYICVVDEFQHWIYAHPDATPTERDAQWCRLFDIYLPGVDYSGVEKYQKTRWYAQAHIFDQPFYYIDYALAEVGALQLAGLDRLDHARALEAYLSLCRIGGTMSLLQAFRHAGLGSPFDEKVITGLSAQAEQLLL